MVRAVLSWSVVALLAATAGCRMCAHPHDYCGPVDMGACGPQCMPNARAGSILADGMPMVPAAEVDYQMDSETGSGTDSGEIVPIPDDMAGSLPGIEERVGRISPVRPQRFASRLPHRAGHR